MRHRPEHEQIEVVDDHLAEMLRKLTPAERVALTGLFRRAVREWVEESVRRQHPDWPDERVTRAVAREMLPEPGIWTAIDRQSAETRSKENECE